MAAVIVNLTAAARISYAQTTNQDPLLVFDPTQLDDVTLAAVLKKLASASQQNLWATIIVRQGDNLASLVNRYYRFGSSPYPVTSKALATTIGRASGLSDVNVLKPGDELKLPPLPVLANKPTTGSVPQFVQVLDTRNASMSLMTFDDVVNAPSDTTPRGQAPATIDVSTVTARLPPTFYRELVESLNPEARDKFLQASYFGPDTHTAELEFDRHPASATQPFGTSSSIDLSGLDPTVAGTLYVMDFFSVKRADEACPHGARVQEVVRQVLTTHGADHLANQIRTIDLDFRSDTSPANQMIDRWVASRPQSLRGFYKNTVESNRKLLKSQQNPFVVPIQFLQILYEVILSDSSSSIVNNSFYTRVDQFDLLPSVYRPSSVPIFLGAVSSNVSFVESAGNEQPAVGFWTRRHDYGVLLVGAESAGQVIGMQSESGDGVVTLARGDGWGGPGTCIRPTDVGTSYSTPAVATQLYLARAVWRQKKISPDTGPEARLRIAVAGEVSTSHADHYASGGPIVLAKLLQDGDYVVDESDAVTSARIISGSFSEADIDGSVITAPIRRGLKSVCALQWVGDVLYVFRESEMRWRRADAKAIALTVEVGGQRQTILSLEQFRSRFRQVSSLRK